MPKKLVAIYDNFSLRTKIVLTFGLVFAIIAAIIFFSIGSIIINGLLDLETTELKNNITKGRRQLELQLERIDTGVRDWSNWDDLYTFVGDNNAEFANANLQKESLTSLRINFFLIIDKDGKVVYSEGHDFENDVELSIPTKITADVNGARKLQIFSNNQSHISGLITDQGGQVLLVARPILKTDGSGPANGTLIFAKILRDSDLKDFQDSSFKNVSIRNLSDPELPADFVNAKNKLLKESSEIYYSQEGNNAVSAYTFIDDIFEGQSMIFRITTDRHTFNQGGESITYSFYMLLGIIVTFLLLAVYFMDIEIFRRLKRLIDYTKMIDSPDVETQIILEGNDELAQLNRTLNFMVESIRKNEKELNERQRELIESNKKLKAINDSIQKNQESLSIANIKSTQRNKELEAVNQIMVGRELKMSSLKEEIASLKAEIERLKKNKK